MKQTTVDQLDRFFSTAPFMRAVGVNQLAIEAAERALNVVFSEDYRQFLAQYGGAVVGSYPVFGLARAEPMDSHLWSVVSVTEHFRQQAWPGADSSYVVSMDHAGNPVVVCEDGEVRSFDHDAGEMITIAANFDAYVQRCLARL
jgi:cell wall assembly regulator SMI1